MKRPSLSRNVIFNFLSWLLPLVATFFFTPKIVHGLGVEEYGLYALIAGFIAYSFNLSVSRAIPLYVANYRINNQMEKIGEAVSATLLINLVLGFTAIAIFTLFGNQLVKNVFQIQPEYQYEAKISLCLAGIALLFILVTQLFGMILQSLHRFDLFSSVSTIITFLIPLGNVILVLLKRGVVSLFVWNVFLMLINLIAYLWLSRKLLPETKITTKFSGGLVWEIVKYSGGVITYQALGNVLVVFERICITRINGQEELSYYVVPMTIALSLHGFVFSLVLVLFPMTTEANASKDTARLEKLYTRALKLLNVLVVFMVITLCVLSRELLTVWMGEAFAAHSTTNMILLTISFGIVAVGIVSVMLADSLGRPWLNVLLLSGWVVIAIPLMIFLAPKFGSVGVGYARFFSIVFTLPVYGFLIERLIFGKYLLGFWLKSILLLGLCGSVAGLVQYFLIARLSLSWFTVGITVFISGIIFLCSLFIIPYFDSEEKSWMTKLLRGDNQGIGKEELQT